MPSPDDSAQKSGWWRVFFFFFLFLCHMTVSHLSNRSDIHIQSESSQGRCIGTGPLLRTLSRW